MKILLTGGRAPISLDLARQLSFYGHEVYVADTMKIHVCRFSKAVKKSFCIPSPRESTQEFLEALNKIIREHQIELYIPMWEEVLYVSKNLSCFPDFCRVFASSFEILHALHNKWLFINLLKSHGLKIPETVLINSQEDLDLVHGPKYVLKRCYSRAALELIDFFPPEKPLLTFIKNNPWIAQEWIEGEKFCTYSVCKDGKVLAHGAYPVKFTVNGHSCLTFESIDQPAIFEWIKEFISKINFTGQISFDLILTPNGDIYAIECNPRATSGIHLFSYEDRIDQAFTLQNVEHTILPKKSKKQIAIGMMLYGWRVALKQKKLGLFFKHLFSYRDVIFDSRDILPLIFEPLSFSYIVLKSLKIKKSLPVTFTYELDWDGDI